MFPDVLRLYNDNINTLNLERVFFYTKEQHTFLKLSIFLSLWTGKNQLLTIPNMTKDFTES
jgi:hypothetical protein